MTTTATIVPDGTDKADLAYDLLKHLVAQILKAGGAANFVDGATATQVDTPPTDQICLFPRFLPDEPADAGMVWASEGERLGSQPFRNARATIIIRCKADADGTGYSGGQKANAAAAAIEKHFAPDGHERTLETLASGRRVLAFENVVRSQGGADASQRFLVTLEFTMRISEAHAA